jgi:3-methylfumaryl-CoA hydratase
VSDSSTDAFASELVDTAEVTDVVTPLTAAALHNLLDSPGIPPAEGQPLPILWHWLAFKSTAPQRELGPDGHLRLSLTDAAGRPLSRVYASGAFTFRGSLLVGEELRRSSRVAAVDRKSGRSGELTFVTIEHRVTGDGGGIIEETQVLAYREASPTTSTPPAGADAGLPGWTWQQQIEVDPVLLFRFSALTYNAHRIHYDRIFATEVDGHQGLVVHGPLQAVLLAGLCRRHLPEREVSSFRFRALAPAFDDGPLVVVGKVATPNVVELQAVSHHGYPTMTAAADLA